MKYLKNNQQILNWMRVMRISQGFFFISAMPVVMGSLLVTYHFPQHHWQLLPAFLFLLGSLVFHLGADMINDYCDHINLNDSYNDLSTPFSGGSGVLEEGLLDPKRVRNASYLCFILGTLISIMIAWMTTWSILIFSTLGMVSCWGYSAPPLKFSHRGLGEFVIFLNNGLFIISPMYLAFAGPLTSTLILPSLILGFMGAAIITMNEIPDINADQKVGKGNLVVRFGIKNALRLHKLFISLALLSLVAACLTKALPYYCLVGLVAPIFCKNLITLRLSDCRDEKQLTQSCAATIKLKFKLWLFIVAGFALDFLL